MSRRAITLLAAIPFLALATQARAQRTWIVDINGGPGFHFRQLWEAFQKVAHGDTILVRPGTYAEFIASKAVRVLGGTGVKVLAGTYLTRRPPAMSVSGIPAGKSYVMKGVSFPTNMSRSSSVKLDSNTGSVVFEDVQIDPNVISSPGLFREVSIQVSSSRSVSLNRVRASGLKVSSSTVALSDCTIQGLHAVRIPWIPRAYLDPGTSGIEASASTLILAQCRATGGNGHRFHNGLYFVTDPPHPALSVSAGKSVIGGDGSSFFKAGSFNNIATPALSAKGGSLLHDPNVVLLPSGGGKSHQGFTTVARVRLPSLTASGAPPGGKLLADLFSPKGHSVILFASRVGKPLLLARLGQLWLDPGSLFLLDSGVQGIKEHHLTQVPIPSLAALRGLTLAVQGLSGASLPALGLTTPAHVVIH